MTLAAECLPAMVPNFPALSIAGPSDLPGRATIIPPRILVVDDELDIRETLELLLSQASYQVTTADSGISAIAVARTGHFDLLLTDLRMPGMSGAETITQIKQLDPEIRVIVATGYPSEETAADCRRRGADAFLKKPFDIDELFRIVERLLKRP